MRENIKELLNQLKFTIEIHDETFKKIVIKNATHNEDRRNLDIFILKMYTNAILKIKSIYNLADSGQYSGIGIITRSVIETMAYLDFILEDNSIEKSNALRTSFEIREEKDLKRAVDFYKKTNELEMLSYTNNLLKGLRTPDFFVRKKDYLNNTIDNYNKKDTSGARFYSYKNKIYSFLMLCKYLDKVNGNTSYEANYIFFYGFFSRDVHGLNLDELSFVGQSINTEAFVNKDIEKYLQIIFSISLSLNQLICEKLFEMDYKQFAKEIIDTTGIRLK